MSKTWESHWYSLKDNLSHDEYKVEPSYENSNATVFSNFYLLNGMMGNGGLEPPILCVKQTHLKTSVFGAPQKLGLSIVYDHVSSQWVRDD